MALAIDKPDTLQGEHVHIRAESLRPHEIYKFVMILKHKYGAHAAWAVFRADASGHIDLTTASPLRGTYSGVDGMGLFMSQIPTTEFDYGGYLRCTPPVPFYYRLQLLDNSDTLLDTLMIKKHWMHPSLERREIEEDGFCATLFKPPGVGPFPTVMDISGTGGGLHEHKGSMLASEGFVVLCVAFFQYKSLVKKLEDVDIEYFQKPVDWLMRQSYTNNEIGIQGVSFGATLVDILSTRHPEIKAVVSINGPYLPNAYTTVKANGKIMPQAEIDDSYHYFINSVLCTDKMMATMVPTKEALIPFEKVASDVAYRFVASVDDLVNNSIFASREKERALRETGHQLVEVDLLNGGHIMEPPYFPHHNIVYAKFQGFYCGYGGEVVLHGKSQEVSWQRTINFFKRYLGEPVTMPDWTRQEIIMEENASRI